MDPKALKKLVKTCRELGVLNYKGPDFEFTLSHDAPVKVTKSSKSVTTPDTGNDFETDTLTDEELMMWSAGSGGQTFSLDKE